MLRAVLAVAIAVCTGCPDSEVTSPDSGVRPDATPDAPPSAVCNVFGEKCESAPFPANTLCHDDKGWCIDDVCRPQCSESTPRCDGIVFARSPAGGGYCAPR